jgi:hypothetical protein
MRDFTATLLSQFATSPSITADVANWNAWIRPDIDLDNFYSYVWNVQTAQGFGLDILGRIVGVTRNITIPGVNVDFGFKEALPGSYGFGQAPFYNGQSTSSVYQLADDAFRTLILAKAAINICSLTCQSINALLQLLFPGRGNCFVVDLGNMQMRYVFEFPLQPWELAIVNGGFLPRPSGVLATVQVIPVTVTFGFYEGGYPPFGFGNFFY